MGVRRGQSLGLAGWSHSPLPLPDHRSRPCRGGSMSRAGYWRPAFLATTCRRLRPSVDVPLKPVRWSHCPTPLSLGVRICPQLSQKATLQILTPAGEGQPVCRPSFSGGLHPSFRSSPQRSRKERKKCRLSCHRCHWFLWLCPGWSFCRLPFGESSKGVCIPPSGVSGANAAVHRLVF